jgi:glycosyltransferase involved in cell wall biosynthesis
LAGCLIKLFMDIPLLITAHSLEPLRPWKREQIGAGYHVSRWLEKTALEEADGVIAVSQAMKNDILRLYDLTPQKVRVIYNGIDAVRYRKVFNPDVLASFGINPLKPYVLFVGRISRQKGIIHLVRAYPTSKSRHRSFCVPGRRIRRQWRRRWKLRSRTLDPAHAMRSFGFPKWFQ